MKKHMGKIIVIAVAVIAVILGIVFGLKGRGDTGPGATSSVGSNPGNAASSSVAENVDKMSYTVHLRSTGGMVLKNVGVYIYTDFTKSELVWFERTDESGMMTFRDVVSDSYVAVLEGLPVGYAVEDYYPLTGEYTNIHLNGARTPYEEAGEFTYDLGSMVYDFTVTTPDGVEYTFSKLLQEKKLIVLNFWYTTCDPCKKEFPVIQSVSEGYAEDAIVLCMNPYDGENDKITAVMEELGLTLPMAGCGSEWIDMMGIMAYPTTVIIDRYGMISLKHTGSITNPEVWERIFDHYTSDDYGQVIYDNISTSMLAEGLELEGELQQGSEDNPIEVGTADGLTVDVAAGEVTYLTIYKMNNIYLTIKDPDAYIIYNGKTYTASNGRVTVWLTTKDIFSGMEVGVGNSSSEDKTFNLVFASKAGSVDDPYKLTLGEFTTKYDSGNDQGIYYTWTATESGVLTLENISCSAPNGYSYVLYNLNSYSQEVSENESVSIEVMAGQTIQVVVGVMPDSGFNYPSATLVNNATFVSGDVDNNNYPFVITVLDEAGNPMADITMSSNGVSATTDETGVATFSMKKGEHNLYVTVPNGYQALTGPVAINVTGEEETDVLTVTLQKIRKYTVTVIDQGGCAVSGATVTVGETQVTTNASGVAELRMVSGEYFADVTAQGYTGVTGVAFDADLAASVTLEAALLPYAVTVTDANGAPIPGAVVTVPEQTATLASGAQVTILGGTFTADANGVASYESYLAAHDLTIACEGYFADVYSVAAGTQTNTFALRETATYTVQVLSSSGEAVEGVTVLVNETSGLTNTVFTGTSDENGAITILAPKGGSYVLRVEVATLPDGYAFDSSALTFDEDNTLTITLMSDRIFAVQVVDQNNAPVAGAEVTFHGMKTENQEIDGESTLVETPVTSTANTNADGIAYFVASAGTSAEIALPKGYRPVDGEALNKDFGDETQLTFYLQTVATYSVTLKDYSGNLVSGDGMSIQLVNGENSYTANFVDGVASIELDRGDYSVTLTYDAAACYVDRSTLTLTATKTTAEIRVADVFSGETESDWYGEPEEYGTLRHVTVGNTYLTLTPGKVNYITLDWGENDEAGYYSFRFDGKATVYFYGLRSYLHKNDSCTDTTTGVCTTEITTSGTYVIGLIADEDATGGVLTVAYEGAKVVIPSENYNDPNYTATDFTLPSGTLTAFGKDLLLNSDFNSDYGQSDAFVEKDGYLYYVSGGVEHQLFINFNWTISLSEVLSNGNLSLYIDRDGDGEADVREVYTTEFKTYIAKANNGYYPLNKELLYMLINGGRGDSQGWWDPDSITENYNTYFSSIASPENAWMAFLAYLS